MSFRCIPQLYRRSPDDTYLDDAAVEVSSTSRDLLAVGVMPWYQTTKWLAFGGKMFGVVLMIAGIFFPPLIIAGAAVVGAMCVIDFVSLLHDIGKDLKWW